MIDEFTPDTEGETIRNILIDELQSNRCYEIVRWDAYLTDEMCMDLLRKNTNPNVIMYIAMMKGITPIVTIGQFKSFVADFSMGESNQSQQSYPSPVYNNTMKEDKHLLNQKDSV